MAFFVFVAVAALQLLLDEDEEQKQCTVITLGLLLGSLPVVIPLLLLARRKVQLIRYLIVGGTSSAFLVSILIDFNVFFEVISA